MATQPIDYDELAKQAGAISSAPAPTAGGGGGAPGAIDYAALAKEAGAISSDPATPGHKTGVAAQPGVVSRLVHGVYDTTLAPAVQAVTHPLDTAAALGKKAIGKEDLDAIGAAVKAGDYKGAALHLGKWALNRTPEGAAVQTGYDLLAPTIDAAKQGDLATATGRAIGTAASTALPGIAGKLGEGVDALADSAAGRLTKSALKGGYTVNTPAEDVASAAATMREHNIPLTAEGATKISDALGNLRQAIVKKAGDAAKAGVTVDPKRVMQRLDELRAKYEMQVNPVDDLKDIDRVGKNFMAGQTSTVPARPASSIIGPDGKPAVPATPASSVTVPIPADQAQAMKVGSNILNTDKYGKISTAQVEAEKALTRGIKEELEAQIPELKSLNAKQATLMNLDDILSKAVNKYTNSAGFAGDLGHTGIAASALRSVIANPVLKARLAGMIDLARNSNPGRFATSAGGGAAAVNNLIASLTTEPQK